MILIGTIGQLIFKQFLDTKNINYTYQLQAGKYDDFDFKIKDEIYEIKSSGYNNNYNYLNLLYTTDQYDRGLLKGYKYCIQIFINRYNRDTKILEIEKYDIDIAIIYGYILFDEIVNYKHIKEHYGYGYKVPLTALHDIEELINNAK